MRIRRVGVLPARCFERPLPAICAGAFLLAAFVVIYRRRRERHVLSAIAGLVLSFAAAAVQQSEVAVPALNLSHNALYHVMQAVALLLIFFAAQALTREDAACPHGVNS